MSQKSKRLVPFVTSTLLGGVGTALILVLATVTGARLTWWAATTLGALVGVAVSSLVFRRG